MELADSVTLDPHKWLAMPFEVGCLMVRDGANLERAFELHPEYLQEGVGDRQAVNFADRGLQLTRASRAIKVWLAIQTFGVDAFRAVIERAMELTLEAQRRIETDDRLELITPASLGVLTFRRRGSPDAAADHVDRVNETIVATLAAAGDVLLTSTVIGGRYAIRLCVLNHTTAAGDVEYALERVASVEVTLTAGKAPIGHAERGAVQAAVAIDWLIPHDMAVDEFRRIPSFATVTDDQAGRFLATGRDETYATGDAVTERWALARTFYLVRLGFLLVRVGDREVNILRPGDHLGEIAAIDWGRDFSYGRTATVVATEPSHLLAFPAAALRELMLDNPDVDRAIRRVAQARLGSR
jgi:hypothetical protein